MKKIYLIICISLFILISIDTYLHASFFLYNKNCTEHVEHQDISFIIEKNINTPYLPLLCFQISEINIYYSISIKSLEYPPKLSA
jgi:hypothetical protein